VATRIVDLELLGPLPPIAPLKPGEGFLGIVRVGPAPVGRLAVPAAEVARVLPELAQHVPRAVSPARFFEACRRLGEVERRPGELSLPAVADIFRREAAMGRGRDGGELVSVIVCTRRRREHLIRCLNSLLAMTGVRTELILVDNNEPGESVFDLAGRFPCRYVKSVRPGLARSRNLGLAEARGEIVAFTHDDAEVDPGWGAGLVAALAEPGAVAATGPVLPRELATRGQEWFEDLGWTHPCWYRRRVLEPGGADPGFRPGAGANLAFRRAALVEQGGFDELLGPGTPTAGGDDTDALWRVLRRGGRVVYTPEAVVRHRHRIDMVGARAAAFQRMTARTAALARLVHREPGHLGRAASELARCVAGFGAPPDLEDLGLPRSRLSLPVRALASLYGPLSYLQSLWHAASREDSGS